MTIRDGFRAGLISFGVIFYLDILGLPLTLGRSAISLFAATVALLSLLFLMDRRGQQRPFLNALVNGTIIGAISGVGLALVTAWFARMLAQGIQVNKVLAQVLPEHVGALTGLTRSEVQTGTDATGALIRLALLLTASGLAGGLLTRLFTENGRARLSAYLASRAGHWLVLALPFIVYAALFALRIEGVSVAGSQENILGLVLIFTFVTTALVASRRANPGAEKIILGVLLLLMALALPRYYNDQFQNAVMGKIAIFVSVGLGLNIVIGYAGMLHLGYVAFFAIGAYALGLLASPGSYFVRTLPEFGGLAFWEAFPLAIIAAMLVGLLLGLPILRTRGDYLAIVTLGFAEIIRLLLLNLRGYTGGPGGVLNIPPPVILDTRLSNPRDILYLGMVLAAVVIFVTVRLKDSRIGRAWLAMREDEDVAQTMGINLASAKMLAFAIGASFAGAAGALYAARQVNIFPDNFDLLVAIDVLSLIIIGGIGSIEGIILGAMALVGLPEILRGVNEYRIVAFGALLVIMMIVRPEGLLPSAIRQRELHAEEMDQDAWLKMAGPASKPPPGDGTNTPADAAGHQSDSAG